MACSMVMIVVAVASAAKAAFTTTWKAPGAEKIGYAGKKVVGLIVSEDQSVRMSGEEELARELTAKGAQGMAAYRVIPREEIHDPDKAKAWFERMGAAGVVIMRLVDLSKEKIPSVVVWSSGAYYDSLWSYYPYAWTTPIALGPGRTEVKVLIETLVFDVASNRLVWAGTSESDNPDDVQALVKGIVDSASDRIRKDGLMRRK